MTRKYTPLGRHRGQHKPREKPKAIQAPRFVPPPPPVIVDIDSGINWTWILGESK